MSEQNGERKPLTRAQKEARLKRKKARRRKKIIRFCVAWGALIAVIILVIVLLVSCIKSCSASSQKASEETTTEETLETETETTTEEETTTSSVEALHEWDGVTAEEMIENGDATKVVFLTFDDGPGENTSRLLDILAKYDVKVTFFCVGWQEEYFDNITRAYNEGHTIAVHSFLHTYEIIYTDTQTFWDDNQKMKDIIVERTGAEPDLMRFPGGSSNHVSASYCEGIMTTLTEQTESKGYEYVDWNVSSGDGGATDVTAEVYQNVIDGIEAHDISVVLMHDSHDYTVNAVEDILTYCLDRGYTLLPLHKGIYTCHHGVWN